MKQLLFFIFIFLFSVNQLFAQISADKTSGCVPLSVNFTGTSGIWNFGDGTGNQTKAPNPNYSFSNPGTYIVSHDTYTLEIIVHDNPTSSFTQTSIEGCASIDNPFNVSFTSTSTSPDAIQSWYWFLDDTNTSTNENPVYNYTTGGTYTVSLVVQTIHGCQNTATKLNLVKLKSHPDVRFSESALANCAGDLLALSPEVVKGSGNITTHLWTGAETAKLSATDVQNPDFESATEDGSFSFTYKVIDEFSCYDSEQVTVNVEHFTVNAGQDTAICYDSITIKAQEIAGGLGEWSVLSGTPIIDNSTMSKIFLKGLSKGDNRLKWAVTKNNCTFSNEVIIKNAILEPPVFTYGISGGDVTFSVPDIADTEWFWSFGDGETSIKAQPEHTYNNNGFVKTTLLAKNTAGCMNVYSDYLQINSEGCKADFDYSLGSGNTVSLTNKSIISDAEYVWQLENGKLFFTENPEFEFTENDINVRLIINDNTTGCSDAVLKKITKKVGIDAQFIYFIDSLNSKIYLKPNMQDPTLIYNWQFGDGQVSNKIAPEHTYSKAGYYLVKLKIYDKDTGTETNYEEQILIANENNDCQADFYAINNGENNEVRFFAQAQGKIKSYSWALGDGTIAKTTNTAHTYSKAGFYNVCLTVIDNSDISNMFCKDVQVGDVGNECLAQFEFVTDYDAKTVYFKNTSLMQNNKYTWDFGDENTSANENPVHTYTEKGVYRVHLHTESTSENCVDDYIAVVNLNKEDTDLVCRFGALIDGEFSKTGDHPTNFVGAAFDDPVKVEWTFGDGTTNTTTTTPTHQYAESGNYEVCFTVSDPITEQQSISYCQTIQVEVTNVANFSPITDELQVMPNPAKNNLTITYKTSQMQDASIELFDIAGQKIMTIKQAHFQAGEYSYKLDVSHLKSGIYIVKLHSTNAEQIKKVMIIK